MDPEALELEHVIGSQRIVICNGEIESQYVSSIGSSVMLADIHDPHKQVFLYGHDSPITALDISASNSKIASGAMQSPSDPKGNALVIVWDYQSQQPIHYLIGIFGAISHVKFSPDEKLLAAAGSDNTVSIWDVESGEQVRMVCLLGYLAVSITFSFFSCRFIVENMDSKGQMTSLLFLCGEL